MRVDTLTVGMFQSNAYVVSCEDTKEALLVDAGDEGDRIIQHLSDEGLQLKMIVATHGHIDHVGALGEIADALSVPVFMHEDEQPVYRSIAQQATLFGMQPPDILDIKNHLSDGDKIRFGKLTGRVIHTPGHSPGGITIVFDEDNPPKAFVGDVLFRGSIGRTDLMGASTHQMFNVLKNVFLAMPDDMVIYSGHGLETTIGLERRTNPFLLQAAGL
ncbi:MAG: MBL fold metallo-hydrolase [Candidatus Latescibacterota bacterium]|nr:MAG: MBL fold metallo-hydrolase [Candidatus Latescibacterota bacterium]